MSFFSELRKELENYLSEEAIEQVHKAYLFAAQAHQGQQRYSGDPYIIHPLAVAHTLAEMRMDPQTIMAAILHDVIEDTATDKTVLAMQFGNEVAELVDGVSKLVQIQFNSRAEAQAENFRKMLLAMAKDIRVIIIKLADRLHNMRTLDVLPTEKRQRIAKETLEIYAPIANRLGMHAFHVEFEDLAFAALHPYRYRVLQEGVRKAKRKRKKAISNIETAIKEHLEYAKLPPSLVWGRQKHLYSLYKEMTEKHMSFAELMDIYTFCIVVDSIDTCYRALGAAHNLYKPLPERFRDYIALPKANGYQALHTTLFGPQGTPIELQIRTVEMDNRADSGIASHWLNHTGEQAFDAAAHLRANAWLKRLLDIQQNTGNPLEFIENVKTDLFPDEVYVFTPDGDIMELPRGATLVDFAYAVHSDIGNSCVAARIDRRLAPLSTQLANGQTVEVITAENAQPNPAWLNFVVTGKAHSNIRHYLKSQRRTEAITFGRRLLDNALNHFGSAWKKIPERAINEVLQQHHCKTIDDLIEMIGLGNQNPQSIAEQLLQIKSSTQTPAIEPTLVHQPKQKPLAIKGTEGKILQLAECCHPIPGDLILGIIQSGQGIIIHAEHCKKITKSRHRPEQLIPVYWDENIKGNFKVEVRLEAKNQPGVLAQLASAIAQTKANIDNISITNRDGDYSTVVITLSVQHRLHLAQVIKRLRNVKAVMRLARSK